MNRIINALAATVLTTILAHAFEWEDYYTITPVPLPKTVDPQIGGLAHLPDGRMAACFHRGEVKIYDHETKQWSLFAEGLHEPLGILAEEDGSILIVQRPEITRLKDTDNDGKADQYECLNNDWGMSGNYHEFTFGLVKDSQGSLYISCGTASSGSGVRDEVRGEWNNAGGLTHDHFRYDNSKAESNWKTKKEGIPRMYARVPYRGCILKIPAGSKKAEVYATGFRTPNGLYMDKDDRLWVADNQGDWVSACKLFRVEPGGFHGHAASLLWDPKAPVTDAIPAELPAETLDQRRVKEAGLFPQSICSNSLSQMAPVAPSFVPTQNSSKMMFVGDVYRNSRFLSFYQDEVNGTLQGAACHVFTDSTLSGGNNRMLFSKDGKTLFMGKTHLSWPGREGIKKVTYNGKPYLMAEAVHLTPTGFEFTFNSDIQNTGTPEDYEIRSYSLSYHARYGSELNDQQHEDIAEIKVKGNTLTIKLKGEIKAGFIYDITLPTTITSEHSQISSHRFWYTAQKVH